MNRRRLTPPTHFFILVALCTISIRFWHLIQSDVFSGWINKLTYPSGGDDLIVNLIALLVLIDPGHGLIFPSAAFIDRWCRRLILVLPKRADMEYPWVIRKNLQVP
jgi:hypothetical protein